MYRFIQRNKKKLLAIFAAGLMVVFILPTTFDPQRRAMNPVHGHIGETPIRQNDIQGAYNQWQMLTDILVLSSDRMGQPQWMPLVFSILGQDAVAQIQAQRPMYYLLLREAQQYGLRPTEQQLESVMAQAAMRMQDGSIRSVEELSQEQREVVEGALTNLLSIYLAFDRAASVVKISEPMRRHALATQAQAISLDLIEFRVEQFTDQVPAPTPEDLQQHFEQYANMIAAQPNEPGTEANPFGFGYMYPDRVQLQYIAVPRGQLREQVRQSRSDYEWEVEAQRYYRQNQARFTFTPPAEREAEPAEQTPPMDAPADAPEAPAAPDAADAPEAPVQQGAAPIDPADEAQLAQDTAAPAPPAPQAPAAQQPAAQPATQVRPFEEVRAQVMDLIIEPQVDKLAAQVQGTIGSHLNRDWVTYQQAVRRAGAADASPAAATSSLGVPFDSYDYLQRLAQEVQKQHGILPTVASLADRYYTREELRQLPGIGNASFQNLNFADYAIFLAEGLIPQGQQENPYTLSLWEPSQLLSDPVDDTNYVFRLTDAQRAHRPASVEDVAGAVENDWRTVRAFELARDAATKTLEAARASSLQSAAAEVNRDIINTGLFRLNMQFPIPNYELPPAAKVQFLRQSFNDLLSQATEQDPHPLGIIEMHRGGRLAVARIADVRGDWFNDMMLTFLRENVNQMLTQELRTNLHADWFDYNAVIQRLNYQPATEQM